MKNLILKFGSTMAGRALMITMICAMVLGMSAAAFASDIDSDKLSVTEGLSYKVITEDEYCKSLAEKKNITFEEAKVLSQEMNQKYMKNSSWRVSKGIVPYGLMNITLYQIFFYDGNNNMGIEVGFPCKIDVGPSSGAYVMGSEGAAYALEIGQEGHVYKKGVLTGEIQSTNKARIFTRGNFEFKHYYRTPVVEFETYKYATMH